MTETKNSTRSSKAARAKKPSVSMMFSFGRGCGSPLRSDGSPYPQVSRRLERLGHHKNPDETDKAHCVRYVEVIQAMAAGFGKSATGKKAKSKPDRQAGRAPTEQSVKAYIEVHSKIDPASSAFLSSFEWKAVRMMALKKYGPVCQCCGATPATGAVMNVDHIKPRKIFPQLALDVNNLQVLCGDCNAGKGNWDMTDWRDHAAQAQAS